MRWKSSLPTFWAAARRRDHIRTLAQRGVHHRNQTSLRHTLAQQSEGHAAPVPGLVLKGRAARGDEPCVRHKPLSCFCVFRGAPQGRTAAPRRDHSPTNRTVFTSGSSESPIGQLRPWEGMDRSPSFSATRRADPGSRGPRRRCWPRLEAGGIHLRQTCWPTPLPRRTSSPGRRAGSVPEVSTGPANRRAPRPDHLTPSRRVFCTPCCKPLQGLPCKAMAPLTVVDHSNFQR